MKVYQTVKAYIELTKPRALAMIVFTTTICYLIAATDTSKLGRIIDTAIGVCIAAAGSLALNQHLERSLDSRMVRTRTRPIPSGRVTPRAAFIFGWLSMILGYGYLWVRVNSACSLATMACGFSYLYLYTPLKKRSSFSSFVGAVPGALLPIMGWVAARDRLEIGAWILFVILFLWQIPHALIISIRHHEDYESVGMKQLPVISHGLTANRQILLHTLILVPVSISPVFFNITEIVYPIVALILGFFLFIQLLRFVMNQCEASAKRAFISLTAYLPILLVVMYLDKPG